MTDSLQNLYNQAVKEAERYLTQNRNELSSEELIRIFLTKLLDCGYDIAPLHATEEMTEEHEGTLSDYHRSIYRKMILRRPRIKF
jgi:hypothetical protein